MALLSSDLQTRAVKFVTNKLKSITHTEINISEIYYKPFKTLDIRELYIEDDHNDTLFYIHKLSLSINWINIEENLIYLNHVNVDSAKVYFSYDSTNTMNLERFIATFDSDTIPSSSDGPPFVLKIDDIKIRKTNFRLKSFHPAPVKEGINYEDMFFKNINIDSKKFKLQNAFIWMDIKHLSTIEQSGAKIDTLQGHFSMDETGIGLENTNIRIDSSYIRGKKQKLIFSSFKQMNNFLTEVIFDLNLSSARIRTKEISLIVPEFKSWNLDLKVQGKVVGPISKLKTTYLKVYLTDSTFINTSLNINGLPYIEDIFTHAFIHRLNVYPSDLAKVKLLMANWDKNPFPDFLKQISFKGEVYGFIDDMNIDGQTNSNVGDIYTKVSYTSSEETDVIIGNIQASNLRMDKISGNNRMFGGTSLNATINAEFNQLNQLRANIKSDIYYFDFNQYRVNNITVNGLLTDKDFDGDILIADSALDMNFTGNFEYATEQLNQKFLINLRHADLNKLNIDPTPKSIISADIMATISGFSPNEIKGNINILDLIFNRDDDSLKINDISIESQPIGYHQDIKIKSDFFKVNLLGNFLFEDLSPAISQLIAQYTPQSAWDTTTITNENTAFNLKVEMLNIQPLIKLFTSQISISNNTILNCTFNKKDNLLLIETASDQMEIAGMKMKKAKVRMLNLPHSIQANLTSNKFNYTGDYALNDLKISSIIHSDNVDLNINWDNSIQTDTTLYSGNINMSVAINANDSIILDKYAINLDPSYIVISDTLWELKQSQIVVDTTSYEFRNFNMVNGFQSLNLNGKISELESDTLAILAKNINVTNFNLFTKKIDLELKGVLDAHAQISNIYNKPFVGSDISLNKLTINNQLIGDTKISTEWNSFLKMIHLDWLSTIANTEVMNIVGDYDPKNTKMNFKLFIDQFNLSILEPYLEDVIHDIEGLTTAEVILKGPLLNPQIQGVLILDRTAFTVNYTQTRYEITDWFDISPDAIYLKSVRVTDENNNYGYLDGKITHNNFDNIKIDVDFNSHNLMFLNTRQADNEIFYGSLFASGETKISGTMENLDLSVSMKTNKNTKLFIPLENGEQVSKYDFIKFKQKDTVFTLILNKPDDQEETDMIGINMNLDITPDAEIQIVFDKNIGDIIKSRGSADLNVTLSKSGDLNMYGDYIIEKGDYLFTLQDVFQKHLTIAKGSNISWAGDPMDAIVDIDAIYKVRRASIYDLTFNTDQQDLVVPVETHLLMTGALESPNIGFNLNLPSNVEDIQEQINDLPKEEIDKQVLSLLVMSKFLPLPNAQAISTNNDFGVESNASEILSNQVSNWLSQISNSIDIGFNYTPGDEIEGQEYEVAISTQLLNNRVTVQTNLGIGGQQVEPTTEVKNTSSIAGDFQVDVKLNKSGKIRLKAYAKSNEDIYNDAETTQGVGVFYREEFNTLRELWYKLIGLKKKTQKNKPKTR